MKKIYTLLTLLFVSNCLIAQSDTTENRKNQFLAAPFLSFSQEKRFEFGAGGLYAFYSNPSPETRVSRVNFFGTYSLNKQYKLDLSANIYTKDNLWHLVPQASYQKAPSSFFGVGDNTQKIDEDSITNRNTRFNFEIERRISPIVYLGGSILYQSNKFNNDSPGGVFDTDPRVEAKNGGNIFLIGPTFIADSRDNANFTTKGYFVRFNTSFGFKGLGDFDLTQIRLDARYFFALNKQTWLASQLVFESLQGDVLPFYKLPQLGGENQMRGYFMGRYRDQNYLTAQSELRFKLKEGFEKSKFFSLDRIILAAFAGFGTVYQNNGFETSGIKPNYGFGGRYLFDPAGRLSIRLDLGFGEKPAGEERFKGFYLSFAEAF